MQGARERAQVASMRPPEFTGGNLRPPRRPSTTSRRFNEAAGIHRRKLGAARVWPTKP